MKTGKIAVGYDPLYRNFLNRILKSKGYSSPEQRQAAFNNDGLPQPLSTLIDKVAYQANKITDSDVDEVKRSGLSEDQVFELIICGAVGQASRQYKNGLTALAEAVKKGGQNAS